HGGFHPSGSGFQVGKLDSLELTGGNRRLKFQLRLGHRRLVTFPWAVFNARRDPALASLHKRRRQVDRSCA
ncbi:MAG: hypothetical protein LW862_17285, partial [Rubrivivax sp.]|nr:hypothetical protein [Rubrivivax sp.]